METANLHSGGRKQHCLCHPKVRGYPQEGCGWTLCTCFSRGLTAESQTSSFCSPAWPQAGAVPGHQSYPAPLPCFSFLVLWVSSKHIQEEIKVKADKQEHNDTERD